MVVADGCDGSDDGAANDRNGSDDDANGRQGSDGAASGRNGSNDAIFYSIDVYKKRNKIDMMNSVTKIT